MPFRRNQSILLCIAAAWFTCSLFAQTTGDALRRGISLLEASRPGEAEKILETIGEDHPGFAEARTLLGYALLQRSALDDARRAFEQALAGEARPALARLGLGITLLRSGEAGEAARQFEKIFWHSVVGRQARAQHIHSLLLQALDEEALAGARDLAGQYPSIAEYRALLGFLYQTRGMSEQALQEFRIAAELDPMNLRVQLSLAAHHRSRGEWRDALHRAQGALEIDPNHPLAFQEVSLAARGTGDAILAESAQAEAHRTYQAERLYAHAAVARSGGDPARAEKLLRECLEKNPRLAKAWTDLGELLRVRNRLAEAEECAVAAVETGPASAAAHRLRVEVLLAMGRSEEALRASQIGIQRGIRDADLFSGMAAALSAGGRNRLAAEAVARAIEELPDNPDLLSYLGHVQDLSGEPENAFASYARALEINPAQANALMGRAHRLLAGGDPASAAGPYRRAAELNPRLTEAWTGLIDALSRSGDQPGAEEAVRRCLEIAPRNAACRERAAVLYMETGRFGISAAAYRELLSSGYSSRSVLSGLAFSLMKSGDYEQSFRVFESSLNEYGDDAWTRAHLGFIARTLGRYGQALQHHRTAHRLSPENPDTAYDLGYTLYLAGDHRAALAALSRAVTLKPRWGLAHFHIALVHWNLKEYGLALANARTALDLGVTAAAPVVQTLSSYLSLGVPRTVAVRRQKAPE